MPLDPQAAIIVVDVRVKNPKALRAVSCIGTVMQSIAEDFEYRDDVKRAVRACNYLFKHLEFSADAEAAE